MTAALEYASVTAVIELLTALLEYLYLFNAIVQFADFLAVKALLLPQNASIIPDPYTYLLCSKLCWHNRWFPIQQYTTTLIEL